MLNTFVSQLICVVVLLICSSAVTGILVSNGEKRTITIAENGDDNETCLFDKSRPCRSLGYVLGSKELNNTLVNITEGFYQLNGTYIIKSVTGLQIAGASSIKRPVVGCEIKNASGLVFQRCENVSLQNLEFQFCGSKFKTTSRAKNASVFSYAALLMEDSKHVNWKNVRISNSTGIGGVFYDVTGKVDMTHVTLEGNIGKMEQLSNTSSQGNVYNIGGGIYIEFKPTPSIEISTYSLTHCDFLDNFAENLKSDVISDSIGQSYFSLGRGGAISFISRGNRSRNTLNINTCSFANNRALWGAGIFCEFDDRSGNNSLRVYNSSFSGNKAVFAGGAIRIGINSNNQRGHNTIEVNETTFKQNIAALGGAFSEYQTVKARTSTVLIYKCLFQDNIAMAASSMHLQNLNATLIEVNISNSELVRQSLHLVREKEQGSLYCYSSYISMRGYNLVDGARNTGFILDFCHLVLNGTANFTRNSGTNGGAMSMHGHAKIRFKTGSKLILHNNKATSRGGAIYVETAVPLAEMFNSTQLNVYKCFFIFGDSEDEFKDADTFNTTIDFLGNSAAPRGGDNVWATTITWCRGKDEPHYNNTALKWKIMKSNGTVFSTNSTVVTSPRFIKNCNRDQWDAHPGIPIHPHITLRDENWNIVNGTVSIQITSIKKHAYLATNSEFQFSVNGNTNLKIKGSPGSKYNITLRTLGRFSIITTMQNSILKKCPPGLYWKNDTCICQPIDKGVLHCDIDANHIFIIPSRWGNVKDNDEFAQHVCPTHYCKKHLSNGVGWLFSKEDQCTDGRDPESPLCSKCREGHSVYLGSEKCQKCNSNSRLWLLLVFAVVLTIMVFAIIMVNLDTYSTYLNGFLYSYQIIPLLITDEEYLDNFISLIMAVTNVSGTGKMQEGFLLWNGMNDMNKLLLNYATPTYLILCTLAFGALSARCRCPFNRRTTFRAFVFISVIAYADFTKLSFKILRPVKLNGHWYVYLAAYMRYFGKDHLPYALTAILITIVVVIGFPLALLFPNYIVRVPRLSRLMGIIDTFQQPFRQEPYLHNFAVFYFLNRLVLLTLYIALPAGPVLDVVFGIACLFILIIFIVYKPYVDWKMNFFDGLQLTNIVIMSIVSAGTSVAYEEGVRKSFKTVNWVLAYVPLLCILYRLLTWGKKKMQDCKERSKSLHIYYI